MPDGHHLDMVLAVTADCLQHSHYYKNVDNVCPTTLIISEIFLKCGNYQTTDLWEDDDFTFSVKWKTSNTTNMLINEFWTLIKKN